MAVNQVYVDTLWNNDAFTLVADTIRSSCATEENPIFTEVELLEIENLAHVKCTFGEGENDYLDIKLATGSSSFPGGWMATVPNRYGEMRTLTSSQRVAYDFATCFGWYATFASGVLFHFSTAQDAYAYHTREVFITKDNSGKPMTVDAYINEQYPGTSEREGYYSSGAGNAGTYVMFANDTASIIPALSVSPAYASGGYYDRFVVRPQNQIVAVPFLGVSGIDDAVYTPDAAIILKGPTVATGSIVDDFMSTWYVMEHNGYKWFTNGYWMFRDEEV